MAVVKPADGKAESTKLRVLRVEDEKTVQGLAPYLNKKVLWYVNTMHKDPDTLILHFGKSGCIVCSILNHPFWGGKCGLIVWMQNPDKLSLEVVRLALKTCDQWVKDEGGHRMISLLGEESRHDKIPALCRLTGQRIHGLMLAKEL